jgi:hypothetical protein
VSGTQRPQRPAARIARGILLLASFRAIGLGEFTASPQAFFNSLAPLIAFPLVGGLLLLVSGDGLGALGDLLATTVALLTPPVVSHALARRWGREDRWLRYAVAFNWCQWAVPLAVVPALLVTGILAGAGLGPQPAAMLTLLALAGYGLGLHWFLARHGLNLSRWRAALFVLLVNMATGLLVVGPHVLASGLMGPVPT